MLRGRVQMGTHQQTRDRWINDKLDDCSQDDQIWGWSIRSSEILDQDKNLLDDDVLRVMLYQGLLDAKPGAPDLIILGTIVKFIVDPTITSLLMRPHLDTSS